MDERREFEAALRSSARASVKCWSVVRATGKSADELSIKEAPVKSHASVLLMRLDVADRTQAVVVALQRGLAHL
jgi:DNA-binding CsgD family transcriptional regulator